MMNYRQPISDEDLEFTKNVLLKSNARRFETLGALRGMINYIAVYGVPFDYIKNEEEIIKRLIINPLDRKKITIGAIKTIAKRVPRVPDKKPAK